MNKKNFCKRKNGRWICTTNSMSKQGTCEFYFPSTINWCLHCIGSKYMPTNRCDSYSAHEDARVKK